MEVKILVTVHIDMTSDETGDALERRGGASVLEAISNAVDFAERNGFSHDLMYVSSISVSGFEIVERDDADQPAPAFPIIHLNGTGYTPLLREYTELRRVANDLGKQLNATTCHARDYYPVEGSWEKAKAAREEIWAHLGNIEKYADEHIAAIYAQER